MKRFLSILCAVVLATVAKADLFTDTYLNGTTTISDTVSNSATNSLSGSSWLLSGAKLNFKSGSTLSLASGMTFTGSPGIIPASLISGGGGGTVTGMTLSLGGALTGSLTNTTSVPALTLTLSTFPSASLSGTITNGQLLNSSVTVGGTSISLGGSASTLTSLTLSSLTVSGLSTAGFVVNNAAGLLSTTNSISTGSLSGTLFSLYAGGGAIAVTPASTVSLAAGTNVTITRLGNTITLSSASNSGTVTGFVVTPSNGVLAGVTTSASVPTLTISLDGITPTSISNSGTLSVSGATTLGSTLVVGGAVTFSGITTPDPTATGYVLQMNTISGVITTTTDSGNNSGLRSASASSGLIAHLITSKVVSYGSPIYFSTTTGLINTASLSIADGTTISTSGSGTLSLSSPAGSVGYNVFTNTISIYRSGETGSYGVTIGNSNANGGTSGDVEITAGGTNKSIRLTPSGTGFVVVSGNGYLSLQGTNPSINDKDGIGRIKIETSTTSTTGFAIWTNSTASTLALRISNVDASTTLLGALTGAGATFTNVTNSGAISGFVLANAAGMQSTTTSIPVASVSGAVTQVTSGNSLIAVTNTTSTPQLTLTTSPAFNALTATGAVTLSTLSVSGFVVNSALGAISTTTSIPVASVSGAVTQVTSGNSLIAVTNTTSTPQLTLTTSPAFNALTATGAVTLSTLSVSGFVVNSALGAISTTTSIPVASVSGAVSEVTSGNTLISITNTTSTPVLTMTTTPTFTRLTVTGGATLSSTVTLSGITTPAASTGYVVQINTTSGVITTTTASAGGGGYSTASASSGLVAASVSATTVSYGSYISFGITSSASPALNTATLSLAAGSTFTTSGSSVQISSSNSASVLTVSGSPTLSGSGTITYSALPFLAANQTFSGANTYSGTVSLSTLSGTVSLAGQFDGTNGIRIQSTGSTANVLTLKSASQSAARTLTLSIDASATVSVASLLYTNQTQNATLGTVTASRVWTNSISSAGGTVYFPSTTIDTTDLRVVNTLTASTVTVGNNLSVSNNISSGGVTTSTVTFSGSPFDVSASVNGTSILQVNGGLYLAATSTVSNLSVSGVIYAGLASGGGSNDVVYFDTSTGELTHDSAPSDPRTKDNIAPLGLGLAELRKLADAQGDIAFNYKPGFNSQPDLRRGGFNARALADVSPLLAHDRGTLNGVEHVLEPEERAVQAMTVRAVAELSAQVAALRAVVYALIAIMFTYALFARRK